MWVMSSSGFVNTLIVQLKPSRILSTILTLQHLVALPIVFLLPLSRPAAVLVCGLVCISLYRTVRHYALLRSRFSIKQFIWAADTLIRVKDLQLTESEAILDDQFYVHPKLIILNLKLSSGGGRTLILCSDSTDRDTLRRLRVKLLLLPQRASAPQSGLN